MFKRIFSQFATVANTISQSASSRMKLIKGRPVELKLADKHEPFGSISIEKIKQTLAEENFAELQSLYYFMLRDLKIASTVLARRQPLLGLKYSISSDNTEFVSWVTNNIKLDELINQISFATYYGVSLIDVQYTVSDGKLLPSFQLVSPRFLHAHRDKVLKTTIEHLYLKQGDTKRFISQLDPAKRIFHKHAVDIGEITDFSLASKLIWYFSLKHLALAHNLQYFDNVATPPLIAKTGNDEDALIDTLYQLKSASVAVFGKDDVIEYLQVSNNADFLAFIEYIDRQIATLVLGNTLSTGEGSKGSYSQSKVHENRQRETLAFDARLIATTVTDYLNRLESLYCNSPQGVSFAFDLTAKKDLKELSEVVKNLSDSGYELDTTDVEAQFGFKIAGKKAAEPAAAAAPSVPNTQQSVANNNQLTQPNSVAAAQPCSCGVVANNQANDAAPSHTATPQLPQFHDTLDAKQPDTRVLEQVLLRQVETLLAESNSFDAAYDALLAAYPNFAIDKLEAALFKAVANSALLAQAEPS